MHYLDHNASAPLLPEARVAWLDAVERLWANPDSPHTLGQRAAAALEGARRSVARLIGRAPRDVTFTSSATEANAMALQGLRSEARPEVWVSAVEHPSALAWGTRRLGVDGEGRLDLDALADALARDGARVAVLSVMAANNETGVLQPVTEVARLARAHGVVFHCDLSQAPGRVPLPSEPDLITLSSHKLGGPRGAAALVGRPAPRPLLLGGAQERGRRAGTPDVPAIVGFGAACAALEGLSPMDPGPRDRLADAVVALGGRVLGGGADRLPNTVCALFPHPGDLIVAALDQLGVAASTGSACASGAHKLSHVLAAMGVPGVPVRLSFGRVIAVEVVISALTEALARLEETCASSSR